MKAKVSANDLSNWLVVIPARLESTRLPNKPLQNLGGKPLIVRVAENLTPLKALGARVTVATNSQHVVTACKSDGIDVLLTRSDHKTGTDRCAEVAGMLSFPFVLNVQGDEPFLCTDDLIRLAIHTERMPESDMATLAFLSTDRGKFCDPNVVKVVRSSKGFALYFSRSPIPYDRKKNEKNTSFADIKIEAFWHHIGVYAFRLEKLLEFCCFPPGNLEALEKLEQLRALEEGWRIYVEPASRKSFGIDTLEELEAARALF